MSILKTSLFLVWMALGSQSFAETEIYKSTENTGLNKQERIDAVEKYLADFSASIKKMESQLDDQAAKIKTLDETIKKMNSDKEKSSAGIRPNNYDSLSELEKVRADINILKNQDIKNLTTKMDELGDTVKAVQTTLKEQMKKK